MTTHVYTPPEPVGIPPLPDTAPAELREKSGPFTCDGLTVHEYDRAHITGPHAAAWLTGTNQWIGPLVAHPAYLRSNALYMGLSDMPGEAYPEPAINMVNCWSGNYFHWLLEMLPTLEGAQRWTDETGQKVRPIVTANSPRYVWESLEMLGYTPDDCYIWRGGHVIADKLIMPMVRRTEGRTAESALWWLFKNLGLRSDYRHRNILISRRNAKDRRLLDESRAAELFGAEIVTLETMTFWEQIDLFTRVKKVIAPHGAGLANLVWCAPGTEVLELFGSFVNPCFYTLAGVLGLDYRCHQCAPVGGDMRMLA